VLGELSSAVSYAIKYAIAMACMKCCILQGAHMTANNGTMCGTWNTQQTTM